MENNNNNPTSKIGPLLKAYRERVRLTQSCVAKSSGISSSMLSQIENSSVSPSINTLFSICNAMGMDMIYLMKAITQTTPVRVFHPDERPKEEYSESVFESLISQADTPHSGELLMMEIKPNQEIALKGDSKNITAMGYVFCGSVSLIIDQKTTYTIKKGDSILFQLLIPHIFRNTSKTTLFRAVWSLTPLRYGFPPK